MIPFCLVSPHPPACSEQTQVRDEKEKRGMIIRVVHGTQASSPLPTNTRIQRHARRHVWPRQSTMSIEGIGPEKQHRPQCLPLWSHTPHFYHIVRQSWSPAQVQVKRRTRKATVRAHQSMPANTLLSLAPSHSQGGQAIESPAGAAIPGRSLTTDCIWQVSRHVSFRTGGE